MDTITQDLRHALRSLRKSPGFSAVAILTLALGIGANTAIFSVMYGVLLRPLPYPEPQRLVGVAQTFPGGRGELGVTYPQYQFLKRHARGLESLAASTPVGFNLAAGTDVQRVAGARVSHDYFRVLSVAPALGRDFLPEEDQPGGPTVVVLSHGLWERQFGGDRGVVGRVIQLDGRPATVVGVMPARFRPPVAVEAWSTLAQVAQTVGGGGNLSLVGRLAAGTPLPEAAVATAALSEAYRREFPRSVAPQTGIDLDSYRAQISTELRTPVRLLAGAIGFVLLIACANVANLMLGRAAARGRELALRLALGATRGRLMRQLLTESVLLSLLGGAVGVLFADWVLGGLLTLGTDSLPSTTEIRLDGRALGFTLGLSIATGLLFGLLPAWHAGRHDLHDALRETTRTASPARQSMRHGLVVGEIALSLVLLAGAGLLVRTFAHLIRTDPGFDPRRVVAAEVWLTGSRHDSTPAVAALYRELTARLEAYPGVEAAAVVEAGLPLQRGGNTPVAVDGEDLRASVDYRSVTPGFFRALGVSVIEGRDFTDADAAGSPPVAIVNESFARRFLAQGALPGRTLTLAGYDDAARQIVGVVRDVRSFVGRPAPPTAFIPATQTRIGLTRLFNTWFPIHVVVRGRTDPTALAALLPGLIRAAAPTVPVGRVRPMQDVLATSLASQRFMMLLLTTFAGLALVLAAVGVYGVIAYLVAQRSREIGVRMALGAQARDVVFMVLRRGVVLTGIGVALGLGGAAALTRLLAGHLYDVRPTDPLTFAGVTVVLALVALVASWVPARRATKVDPMVALRTE